jgi:hypothetical protein
MSKNICTVETQQSKTTVTLRSSPDEDFVVYRVNTTYLPIHGEPITYYGSPMSSNSMPTMSASWNA